jgi:predicted DsbA family dithiol-disulfide isomerase
MKRVFFLAISLLLLTSNLFALSVEEELKLTLTDNFKKRGFKDIDLTIKKIKDVEILKNFYFFRVDIIDKERNRQSTQYIISNGKYLIPDVIDLKNNDSLIKELAFEYDITDIDVSKLTFVKGNKNSKNIIIDVSDFQCPFCRKAHSYLNEKLAGKKDYALFMMHVPLSIHDKAMLYAKIFEAGLMLNKNFSDELYSGKYDNLKETEIIDRFAQLSGNPEEFKRLVNDKKIEEKIVQSNNYASTLGINSTPVIFFNGRKVEGYNTKLIDKGVELLK